MLEKNREFAPMARRRSLLVGDPRRGRAHPWGLTHPPPLPGLSDPRMYSDVFGEIMDFAVFPRESRRPVAINTGKNDKARAWDWARDQIRSGAQGPNWTNRSLVGQLGIIFARFFREIGDRRFPLNVGPTKASRFFMNWNILTDLRISENKRPMESPDVA